MRSGKRIKPQDNQQKETSLFGKKETRPPFFQSKENPASEEEEKKIQTKKADASSGGTGSMISQPVIQNKAGKGKQLPGNTKSKMESAFGEDFGSVNIHNDSDAAKMNEEVNALAFTYGQDIFFNSGKFRPGTIEGDALMAHELAHTIQQRNAEGSGGSQGGDSESEADIAAEFAVRNISSTDRKRKINLKKKSGLSIQRCTSEGPSYMSEELISNPVTTDSGRIINVRGDITPGTVIEDLARIDILGTSGGGTINKVINKQKTNVFEIRVNLINYTEAWIAKEFEKIFPYGTEATIEKKSDPRLISLRNLIAQYRVIHPGSFSKLQGHNLFSSNITGKCIGTYNKGVENLYGPSTILAKDMGGEAFNTIDKLDAKGFLSLNDKFEANYPQSIAVPVDKSDITLQPSFGAKITSDVQNKEDGIHPFLLSLGNGYHSVTIVLYKTKGKIEMLWRDQHWNESKKQPSSIDEIDSQVKDFLVGRALSWVRENYNKKNDPKYEKYSDIPAGPKRDEAAKYSESTVRKDLKINRFGKLKPVDKK